MIKPYLLEEASFLSDLPEDKWSSPQVISVKVRSTSLLSIKGLKYSVPSRLIGYTLKAYIYPEKIDLMYGRRLVHQMPRSQCGDAIDYRHLIDSLIRKPGAFESYQHKESLFPCVLFRKAYDLFKEHDPSRGHIAYLELLHLAKLNGEESVRTAIDLMLEEQQLPLPGLIKEILDMPLDRPEVVVLEPKLSAYDQLMGGRV